MNHSEILIVGASVRAAAESARRAGLVPFCADLFADDDLHRVAERVLRVTNLDDDLIRAVDEFPRCPWMYTGALENRPEVVEAISWKRPLWGNGPDMLAAIRDPFFLEGILEGAGLPKLATRADDVPPPAHENWIRKPRDGAGGRGLTRWNRDEPLVDRPESGYFQQFAEGPSLAGIFLAGERGTRMVGISRQFVGIPRLHAPTFGYCGSLGPLRLPVDIEETVRLIGTTVASACGLRGIFGCDFVLSDGHPFLVEVNPRYTASVEVFERASGEALLIEHRKAFTNDVPSSPRSQRSPVAAGNGIVGKVILYAAQTVEIPELAAFPAAESVWEPPYLADRPRAGTTIEQGHPLCTLFAAGRDEDACAAQLASRANAVQRHLFGEGEFEPLDRLVFLDPSFSSR